MSGHSKWSTIKRKKGAIDAKRGKIFTKINREIFSAVREGGNADPASNPRLRLAIQNARSANMPKDNIDRAIKKASGEGGETYMDVTFEGYGPNGVPIFVECMTDNNNRTVADVRAAFSKAGGSLGTNGSLEFIFDRKGVFSFEVPEGFDEDDFTLEVIDAGAEEVEVEEGYVTVICAMEDFGSVQKALDEMNIELETGELQRIPNTRVSLDDEAFQSIMKLVDVLEDNDDVQKVYHNLEVTDEQMALIG